MCADFHGGRMLSIHLALFKNERYWFIVDIKHHNMTFTQNTFQYQKPLRCY